MQQKINQEYNLLDALTKFNKTAKMKKLRDIK